VIPPGDRGRALLVIDLRFPAHAAAQIERAMDIRVLARSRDAGRPRLLGDWDVHGLVRRHLAVQPPAIDFSGADELVEGVAAPTVTLHVHPLAPVATLAARLEPQIGAVAVTPRDADFEVALSGLDTSAMGEIDAAIVLAAVNAGGGALPEFRVPVRGKIVSNYVVTPRTVTFPPTQIGNEVSATVQVASRDELAVEVELPEELVSGLRAEVLPPEAKRNSRHVLVRLKVESTGDIQHRLPLLVRSAECDDPPRQLEILVRGFGLDSRARIVTRP
jgi:hypothetical protein